MFQTIHIVMLLNKNPADLNSDETTNTWSKLFYNSRSLESYQYYYISF